MAACALNEVQTDFGCFPNDPIGFVQKFYGIGLGFVFGLSLLMFIWGGYTIISSRGDHSRLNVGKSYMFYALVGLLLAIFGYVFIQVVLVDILHVPGFK
jgi:FtsH-binding integral membrane protein